MKNIVLYGGSFNPPHKAHQIIAEELSKKFDKLVIVPCGVWKESTKTISTIYRIEMIKIAFNHIKAYHDFHDLDFNVYTPTYLLNDKYKKIFPDSKIWIAVGEDSIANGKNQQSEIHKIWDYGNEIWNNLNWVIIKREGYGANPKDLPPNNIVIEIKNIIGSGTEIRKLINSNKSISHLVDIEIENYIKENKLYLE